MPYVKACITSVIHDTQINKKKQQIITIHTCKQYTIIVIQLP